MKVVQWIAIALAIVFLGAQAIRPNRFNPPIDSAKTLGATTKVPPQVAAILERSCDDCHSSRTVWPWYSNIAPISWWLADHVRNGRRALSFDEWGDDSPSQRRKSSRRSASR